MSGFLTTEVNNLLLGSLFGGQSFQPPATIYIGLSQRPANKAGRVYEPSRESGYCRVAIPNDNTHFSTTVGGMTELVRPVRFPRTLSAWGVIMSVFLSDSGSDGRTIAMADLPRNISITPDGSPSGLIINRIGLSHA